MSMREADSGWRMADGQKEDAASSSASIRYPRSAIRFY
jgi:uncharacterized protein YfaP (DUF2135 family)